MFHQGALSIVMTANDPFYSGSNNKSNSREDAKSQRNDYHVSVFSAPLRLRENNYFYLFGRSWPISEVRAENH